MLLHGLLHHSFIYSYTNPSTNFIYQSGAIWLCYFVLHIQCATVSSASIHTSQWRVYLTYKQWIFTRITRITENTNLVTMVAMATKEKERILHMEQNPVTMTAP